VLPHPHQCFLFVFLIAILTGVRWNLSVFNLNVLICISLMPKDVEYFLYLLAICTSSFENYLFSSRTHFFIEWLILQEFSFWVPCWFWLLILSNEQLAKIFSYSVGSLLSLVTVSLLCRSFLLSCSPIRWSCLSVVEPLEFSSGSHCLCLDVMEFPLLCFQTFSSYIKIFVPLWIDLLFYMWISSFPSTICW
jgi:hypothetical protein